MALIGSIIGAFCSSLLTSLVIGHYFITYLQKFLAARTREDVPDTHAQKNGTPTMGGAYLLLVLCSNTLIWCRLSTQCVWMIVLTMLSFGAIGLLDDWCKMRHKRGIHARTKFILQWTAALINSVLLITLCEIPTTLALPGCAYSFALSYLFYAWAAFIMVSASNAVNLTDGLDGLATSVYMPIMLFFVFLFSYASSISSCITYVHHDTSALLAIFCAVLTGTLLGFLWYNAYPARLFMGDCGSLSLGAGLAAVALVAKAELLLPIIGCIFVTEVLSVIMQVWSFRRHGKRIFKMAPVHHHFELCGMHENTITIRATIITILMCCFVACALLHR